MSISPKASYRNKLYHAINQLPPIYQSSFKEALKPHEYVKEVLIPKSSSNKKLAVKKQKGEEGDFFRNRVVKFNENLSSEHNIIDQLKSDSDKFSRQYQLVNMSSKVNNKTGKKTYLDELLEVYKKNGYKEDEIVMKENMFKPSLMIEPENRYDSVMSLLNTNDFNTDGAYMERLSDFIKNKGKSDTSKNNRRLYESDHMSFQNNLYANKEEEYEQAFQNKSLREIYYENSKIKRDIRHVRKLLREFDMENRSFKTEDGRNLSKFGANLSQILKETRKTSGNETETDKEKEDPFKKNVVVNDIFVSSKGMIRSAKPKKGEKDSREKKRPKKILHIQINPLEEKKEEKSKVSEKEKNERRLHELSHIYKKTSGGDYIKSERALNRYYVRYGRGKLEPLR